MKTKILITIICTCALFKAQAQEWGYVSSLQNEYLRKIWTQGLDTVYIVGENGLIARSIDQAETWNKQYFPTKVALNDIIFIDHYTGFTVGEQGTILKTTNAGDTWKQITLAISSQINAIAATGLDNIWVVGDNSLILHSTDAGETWTPMNILPENDRQLLDIAFRENLGYFTGNYATVYKTEDYGSTWDKQILAQQSWSNALYAINIMENKTYLMFNDGLYSTEDQINWAFVSKLGYRGDYPFFLNDNVGYTAITDLAIGGGNGRVDILKTTNSGKNWTLIEEFSPYMQFVGEASRTRMINETLGYVIFSNFLFRTPLPPWVGINKIQGNVQLSISQIRDELVLKSESNPIKSIEFFDTLGKRLIYKQWQNQVREINININNLHKGIYLIKVAHSDSTISIDKYFKR